MECRDIYLVSNFFKESIKQYAPEIATLFESGLPFYKIPSEARFIAENYPLSPNISIDYAILEKADNVYTISADIGWSDLDTWASLHSVGEKDIDNTMLILLKLI